MTTLFLLFGLQVASVHLLFALTWCQSRIHQWKAELAVNWRKAWMWLRKDFNEYVCFMYGHDWELFRFQCIRCGYVNPPVLKALMEILIDSVKLPRSIFRKYPDSLPLDSFTVPAQVVKPQYAGRVDEEGAFYPYRAEIAYSVDVLRSPRPSFLLDGCLA